MKTKITFPNLHRRRWLVVLSVVCLLCTFLMGGCECAQSPTATETPKLTEMPKSTAVPLTPVPTSTPIPTTPHIAVASVAEEIATDVGKVMTVVEASPDKVIFVFEETHDSPAGQIEIAIMLNRLYENHTLRVIGLEGAFTTDGGLDAAWFHFPPSFKARDPIRPREDVIVQLLEEGEINSAEMMALTYEDAEVVGIDDAEAYNVELSADAASAPTIYLYLIAIPGLTASEIEQASELIDDEKILEALEFIISTDTFASEMYEHINNEDIIISIEEWLSILDEIEAKAEAVGADIEPEDRANMQALREFYEAADQRSETMTSAVLDLAETHPDEPVAMVVGAAHTERVVELLTDADVSFAVLRTNSLAGGHDEGDLSFEAYDRKALALSVDPPGSLGSLLDGRHKPKPIVEQLWFQVKSKIFLLVTLAARAIAEGHSIADLEGLLPTFDDVTFRPLEIDGNELIFAIDTVDNNGNSITIYGRALAGEWTEKLLEERLFEGLDDVRDRESPDPDVSEPQEVSEPTVMLTASGVRAAVAPDLEQIRLNRIQEG
jgi:hypothetical protein